MIAAFLLFLAFCAALFVWLADRLAKADGATGPDYYARYIERARGQAWRDDR